MRGDLVTAMAGLNCGTPSAFGWKTLKDNADVFLSCSDDISFNGMRTLNKPIGSKNYIRK